MKSVSGIMWIRKMVAAFLKDSAVKNMNISSKFQTFGGRVAEEYVKFSMRVEIFLLIDFNSQILRNQNMSSPWSQLHRQQIVVLFLAIPYSSYRSSYYL